MMESVYFVALVEVQTEEFHQHCLYMGPDSRGT